MHVVLIYCKLSVCVLCMCVCPKVEWPTVGMHILLEQVIHMYVCMYMLIDLRLYFFEVLTCAFSQFSCQVM